MDFSSINNVSDLIKVNSEVPQPEKGNVFGRKVSPEIQKILHEIYAIDPSQGLEIVMDVLTQLLVMHKVAAEEYAEGNQPVLSEIWSSDSGKIEAVLSILAEIEL